MKSPSGPSEAPEFVASAWPSEREWFEPGQRPAFDEYTVVIGGVLVVEHEGGRVEVPAGQAVHCRPGEWVRYSTPGSEGAEYISVCLPAFSPETVRRDAPD